ncbi:MAG: type II toxin-antitoxin system death-on-curing family toxin [Planctomycetota bacterium]
MPLRSDDQQFVFLTIDDVYHLHRDTLEAEGGADGVIHPGMIEAAVAMPQQQFGGSYLHDGLVAMAAAYLFHMCQAHGFRDGNKRVATLCSTVFLRLNGVPVDRMPDPDEFERVVLSIASGEMSKDEVAAWLTEHVDLTDIKP